MDPLSIAALLATLLHVTRWCCKHIRDVVRAKEDQEKLRQSLDTVSVLLRQLEHRLKRAKQNPEGEWFRCLLALATSASTVTNSRKKLVPDSKGESKGAFDRLKEVLDIVHNKLEAKHGFHGVKQRWDWSHDKKKVQDLLGNLEQLRSQIDSILNQDHFTLSLAIAKVAVETGTAVSETKTVAFDTKTIAKDTQDLVLDNKNLTREINTLGIRSNERIRALDEKLDRRDKLGERDAIIEWLSPLKNRTKQTEIFKQSIPMGEDFLRSSEFEAWSTGRS